MSKHKKISFIKSGFRIAGYLTLAPACILSSTALWVAVVVLLVFSETLGIYEEFGEK